MLRTSSLRRSTTYLTRRAHGTAVGPPNPRRRPNAGLKREHVPQQGPQRLRNVASFSDTLKESRYDLRRLRGRARCGMNELRRQFVDEPFECADTKGEDVGTIREIGRPDAILSMHLGRSEQTAILPAAGEICSERFAVRLRRAPDGIDQRGDERAHFESEETGRRRSVVVGFLSTDGERPAPNIAMDKAVRVK